MSRILGEVSYLACMWNHGKYFSSRPYHETIVVYQNFITELKRCFEFWYTKRNIKFLYKKQADCWLLWSAECEVLAICSALRDVTVLSAEAGRQNNQQRHLFIFVLETPSISTHHSTHHPACIWKRFLRVHFIIESIFPNNKISCLSFPQKCWNIKVLICPSDIPIHHCNYLFISEVKHQNG